MHVVVTPSLLSHFLPLHNRPVDIQVIDYGECHYTNNIVSKLSHRLLMSAMSDKKEGKMRIIKPRQLLVPFEGYECL